MAIFYAISGAFLDSLGSIFDSFLLNRKNLHHIKMSERMASGCYANALILGIILIVSKSFSFNVTPLTFLLLASIGLLDTWANIMVFKAMEITAASKVKALSSTSLIVTMMLSTLFLGNSNTLLTILIVTLVVMGIYIINLNVSEHFSWHHLLSPLRHKSVKTILGGAILAGISTVIMGFTLKHHYTSEFVLLFVRMLIMAVYSHIKFRPQLFPPQYKKNVWLLIVFGGEIVFVAFRALNTFALSSGDVIVSSTLSNTAPLFVLILSALFLKEKITRHKIFGTILVVCGISLSIFYT